MREAGGCENRRIDVACGMLDGGEEVEVDGSKTRSDGERWGRQEKRANERVKRKGREKREGCKERKEAGKNVDGRGRRRMGD